MDEKLIKGRRFDVIVLDDVGEVEVSDERIKKTLEWFKVTQALLSDVQVLPAQSNKQVSPSDVTGRIGLPTEKP